MITQQPIDPVYPALANRFEEIPDPIALKVARAVWRVTTVSSLATWRFCCAVAENEAVRGTVKVVGSIALGLVLVPLILVFGVLGAMFR